MSKIIVYKQDNGIPAIVFPTQEALENHDIMDIAVKDVPFNKPFKIMEFADLPKNAPQEVWEVSETDLTDGVGGESYEFTKVEE